jgi:two-component system, cell cycle response regulator CpdR
MFTPVSAMVVDDEKDQTILFSLFLARFGFDSITFNDPLVALKHYGQYNKRYSLVLVDWNMPKIDGIGLARKIREHDSKVKIILITAFFIGDIFAKDEFKEVKIADVIQKPIVLKEFGRRINLLYSKKK